MIACNRHVLLLSLVLLTAASGVRLPAQSTAVPAVFGYSDFSAESKIEQEFLAVPSAKLAGRALKILTAEPHLAATPEDRKTAEYVAQKFREAGFDTEIVPYRVLLNRPVLEHVEAYDAAGHLLMSGPTPEHVDGDPYQANPRAVLPFNSSSASGDVTAAVIYANYCRLDDFNELAARRIDLHGKIVLCRYGVVFRGIKVELAEQRGAAGVLLYSDPQDDGFTKGGVWPAGPWRPDTGIQSGSVQYIFKGPGDPETPGVASILSLPNSARVSAANSADQPHIPSIPISSHDAAPILTALRGPIARPGWQGGLPFPYHLGPAGVTVHLLARQDFQRRIIWDVIGKIEGSTFPAEWVLTGNHRDAWIYGAVDPSSGTASMLETVRGIGELMRRGWRPKRTLVFCSWDAEEEGLIGSTEWVEQNPKVLQQAVAYFNVDIAVSGPDFSASAVPSLHKFLKQLTGAVPSPLGGTVYNQWNLHDSGGGKTQLSGRDSPQGEPAAQNQVHIGNLGSGSDFTPFFQHAGVPSTDIGSEGPYGVYHSTFDDFAWYIRNADPHFVYLQQMARVLGLETLRMADADVLPYDYVAYARAISAYLDTVRSKVAGTALGGLDFTSAYAASARFAAAARKAQALQCQPAGDLVRLNRALRQTEESFLTPSGLPDRPWYRHLIYAPGESTGYAAEVLPGVSEAIDARNGSLATQQLNLLAHALDHAAQTLQSGF
jgi:N-acetylated-alpha-linked acidic dipeptidase